MALKLSEEAPSRPVIGLVYGRGGSRKTSFANTAKRPLVIAFDQRGYSRSFRQSEARVYVNAWEEISAIEPSDLKGYDTLIVDTLGRALDSAAEKAIRDSPKNAIRSTGALSKQGYGAVKKMFRDWLFKFVDHIDVILIAQDRTVPNPEDADVDMSIPEIVGGTKTLIHEECDFIGWARAADGDKFFVSFNPSARWVAKSSPAGLSTIEIAPDDENLMAGIIERVKASIADMANSEKAEAISEARAALSSCKDVKALNKVTKAAMKAEVVTILWQEIATLGTELGYEWDREKKVWAEAQEESSE